MSVIFHHNSAIAAEFASIPGWLETPDKDGVSAAALMRRRRFAMRRAAGQLLPSERVACCGTRVSRGGDGDSEGKALVYRGRTASFLGRVDRCGSVWACPVCSARVAEGRRLEVAAAMARHVERTSGQVWMLTLTIPHHRFDDCQALRKSLVAIWNRATNSRPFRVWRDQLGLVGSIRSLEVTHGGAGWHPHLHVLLFTHCHPRIAAEFGRWMAGAWSASAEHFKVGRVSLDAQDMRPCINGAAAGEYVAKWGSDWEMTRGDLKAARKSTSRNPWQILHDYTIDKWPPDRALFREYFRSFKGSRQLTWSRGLKKLYDVESVSDETLADQQEVEEAKPVASITQHVLSVLNAGGEIPQFLEAVERDGYEGALRYLYRSGIALGLREIRNTA